MTSTHVRPTTPADFDELAAVLVDVHREDGYPVEGVDTPRAWIELQEPIGQWTALLEGRQVGHVALVRPAQDDGAPRMLADQQGVDPDGIAVIARLFVGPRARSRGLAQQLLETAEQQARSAKLRLVLDVMAKDVAAINLYERNGWQVLGSFIHEYGHGLSREALALVGPD